MEFIKYTLQNNVAIVTLNRPKAFNSFTIPMAQELLGVLNDAQQDKNVHVVLLTGQGKAFCAGQDLKEATMQGGPSIDEIVTKTYNPIIEKITSLEKPVVAFVNGVAAGAGANIALACDLTLASEEAKFIQAFSSIALVPDSGGSYFLPRLIGKQRAAAQMFFAEPISAKKAQSIGMIYKVFEPQTALQNALEYSERLAKRPIKAIGLTKKLLKETFTNSLSQQLEFEKQMQAQAAAHNDHKEGINAFFEKRKPAFNR